MRTPPPSRPGRNLTQAVVAPPAPSPNYRKAAPDQSDAPEKRLRISHMTFPELYAHAFSFGTKIDALWQRIIYVHIGMVAAVVYLATTSESYLIARAAVLCFYTFNLVITYYNLRDAYDGLQRTISDLCAFPDDEQNGQLARWVKERRYKSHASIRAIALLLFWLLTSALLLLPVLQ